MFNEFLRKGTTNNIWERNSSTLLIAAWPFRANLLIPGAFLIEIDDDKVLN